MIKVTTPGRICLFGEHQDYLNLPVIAAAISLRINISGAYRSDRMIHFDMPDINSNKKIDLDLPIIYESKTDYFRSGLKVLIKNGLTFSKGFDCEIKSEIPINAGTSSSSALVVSWINFLSTLSDQKKPLTPNEIAELAYQAEVMEFSEAGGMMDQYTTAIGGMIGIESFPEIKTKKYDYDAGKFVLGNSREPKDTQEILSRVKGGVLSIVEKLRTIEDNFSLQKISLDEIENYSSILTDEEFQLLSGTILNRDITFEADKLLTSTEFDENKFGYSLYRHHEILRDIQKISTPKIDRMIDAAINAGALGAKINGSGGGGCMFAYAPHNTFSIYQAVKEISGEAYIVQISGGTKIERIKDTIG